MRPGVKSASRAVRRLPVSAAAPAAPQAAAADLSPLQVGVQLKSAAHGIGIEGKNRASH